MGGSGFSGGALGAPQLLAAPNRGEDVEVFLVLEGGGAKGLAHIGAYRVISDTLETSSGATWPRLKIRGVAGSSVGALVGSLITVGYKPDEIVDRQGRLKIAKQLKIRDIDDLFREGAQHKLNAARRFIFEPYGFIKTMAAFLFSSILSATSITLCFLALHVVINLIYLAISGSIPLRWFEFTFLRVHYYNIADFLGSAASIAYSQPHAYTAIFVASLLGVGLFHIRRVLKGLLPTHDFAESLNKALLAKFDEVLSEQAVRTPSIEPQVKDAIAEATLNGLKFKHLSWLDVRLRIVATDIKSRKLALFSRRETPDVRVADAVAASIAIPVIFKKVHIGDAFYQDGGLISNIPAWTFHDRRSLNPDSWVVAVSLDHNDANQQVLSFEADRQRLRKLSFRRLKQPFEELFSGTLYTAIFGGSTLETRPHDRLALFSIRTDIGTLDFDKLYDEEKVAEATSIAELTTRVRLGNFFCTQPHHYQRFCDDISSLAFDLRAKALERLVKPGADCLLRVVLCRPSSEDDFHRIVTGRQYRKGAGSAIPEPMPDDRLLLPHDATLVGRAFLSGKPEFAVKGRADWPNFNPVRDRYRAAIKLAVKPQDRAKWRWAIPVHIHGSRDEDPSRGEPKKSRYVICIEANVPEEQFGVHEAELRAALEPTIAESVINTIHDQFESNTNIILTYVNHVSKPDRQK